jgi:hypothetical protein
MKMLISIQPFGGLTEFYDTVAKGLGHFDTSELHYDCTKINVAENIQDKFYEYYTALVRETEPMSSENDIKIGITMLLAMSGPKVDSNLKANEVEIFDGFIC